MVRKYFSSLNTKIYNYIHVLLECRELIFIITYRKIKTRFALCNVTKYHFAKKATYK